MSRTFRIGGIHPPGNKLSAGKEIKQTDLPQQVAILLSQHIGAPATPVVDKGDCVKVGTLVAKAGGFISANIHSPVSGTVLKLDSVTDASGYKRPAIIIKVEGDEWEESIDRSVDLVTQTDLDAKAIVERVTQMGIVGMGGATFPTGVKLSPPPNTPAEFLVVNAVECEPYLTGDDALMQAKAPEIMVGCSIVMKALGVQKTLIGIETNKPQAIKIMMQEADKARAFLLQGQTIEIVPLKQRYPQGGEKQLIDAVLRRQVTSGALPISTGAVVQNVATIFAIYEAVIKNKPLIERIVTVTGKSVASPGNFLTRIGTPMQNVIELAGGVPQDTAKVINGGPMMGKALITTDIPVTKGSGGILLIKESEALRKPMRDCVRCGKCVSVCPMGLNPAFLMRNTLNKDWEDAERLYVVDCIECGSCSYTCPANRPLLDHIRLGKQTVMNIIRERKK